MIKFNLFDRFGKWNKPNKLNDNIYKIALFILITFIMLSLSTIILNTNINFAQPIISILLWLGFDQTYNIFTNSFLIGQNQIIINNFCSGLYSISIFIAIILSPITEIYLNANNTHNNSLKIDWIKKIWIILVGSTILYILNILRLALLLLSNPNIIYFVHILGWVIMSLIIFGMWTFVNNNLDKNTYALHKNIKK